MTSKNAKRKKLNKDQVAQIITEWNQKSIDDFAMEFEKAPNTVRAMVYEIRKEDPELCPKKPKTRRADIVKAALQMLKEDQITDI